MRECENGCISLFLSLTIYVFFYLPTFSDVKFSRLSLKLHQLKLENLGGGVDMRYAAKRF